MSVFFLTMSLEQGTILKHRTIWIHLLLLPTLNRELYSYLFASCSSNIANLPIFESNYFHCPSLLKALSLSFLMDYSSSFRYLLIYHLLKNSSLTTLYLYEILTLFNYHIVLSNIFLFFITFIINTYLFNNKIFSLPPSSLPLSLSLFYLRFIYAIIQIKNIRANIICLITTAVM